MLYFAVMQRVTSRIGCAKGFLLYPKFCLFARRRQNGLSNRICWRMPGVQ
jgi:hypothetical protein